MQRGFRLVAYFRVTEKSEYMCRKDRACRILRMRPVDGASQGYHFQRSRTARGWSNGYAWVSQLLNEVLVVRAVYTMTPGLHEPLTDRASNEADS
jgi:hypothetical protein